jgi:hypothetical protein
VTAKTDVTGAIPISVSFDERKLHRASYLLQVANRRTSLPFADLTYAHTCFHDLLAMA